MKHGEVLEHGLNLDQTGISFFKKVSSPFQKSGQIFIETSDLETCLVAPWLLKTPAWDVLQLFLSQRLPPAISHLWTYRKFPR